MKAINEIKELAAKKGMTLTYISRELTTKLNKKYTVDGLSKKLRGNTVRYSEMKIIAEILGYDLVFKETARQD